MLERELKRPRFNEGDLVKIIPWNRHAIVRETIWDGIGEYARTDEGTFGISALELVSAGPPKTEPVE